MQTPAAREERVALAVLRGLGELATFTRLGSTTGVQVLLKLTRGPAPVWNDGAVGVIEEHVMGYAAVHSFGDAPEMGDTWDLADGTRYRIDEAPTRKHGLWSMVLRKLA